MGLIDKTGKEILKTDYEAMGDLNKKTDICLERQEVRVH